MHHIIPGAWSPGCLGRCCGRFSIYFRWIIHEDNFSEMPGRTEKQWMKFLVVTPLSASLIIIQSHPVSVSSVHHPTVRPTSTALLQPLPATRPSWRQSGAERSGAARGSCPRAEGAAAETRWLCAQEEQQPSRRRAEAMQRREKRGARIALLCLVLLKEQQLHWRNETSAADTMLLCFRCQLT